MTKYLLIVGFTFSITMFTGCNSRTSSTETSADSVQKAANRAIPEPAASNQVYTEPFRPQFHFSPAKNWTNDPNGLVYYKDEYHLFYQHNPFGDKWGHMSWGHAVSKDLVHWEHLPVALPEENGVMIFSGTVVVDENNTSGFCNSPDNSCMVAIYTGHTETNQSQHLAYSNDRGRTWIKYNKNPVLDLKMKDFRDPKVLWYAPASKWVMAVALPKERKVQFYDSKDLKSWKLTGAFGPANVNNVIWECPDLYELPVEGKSGQKKWVLHLSLGNVGEATHPRMIYFTGNFDGKTFKADKSSAQGAWFDYGRDYYAAIIWNNTPQATEYKTVLGWMNDWPYANEIPTSPWRGAMALPRNLSLKSYADGVRFVQKPIAALEQLRGRAYNFRTMDIGITNTLMQQQRLNGNQMEIIAEFEPGTAREFGFKVLKNGEQETIVGYDTQTKQLFIDRRNSGNTNFHKHFASRSEAPLEADNGRIKMHIFIDHSSVEVFGNDGLVAITSQVFPDPLGTGIELYSKEGNPSIRNMRAWNLNSIWNQKQ